MKLLRAHDPAKSTSQTFAHFVDPWVSCNVSGVKIAKAYKNQWIEFNIPSCLLKIVSTKHKRGNEQKWIEMKPSVRSKSHFGGFIPLCEVYTIQFLEYAFDVSIFIQEEHIWYIFVI